MEYRVRVGLELIQSTGEVCHSRRIPNEAMWLKAAEMIGFSHIQNNSWPGDFSQPKK